MEATTQDVQLSQVREQILRLRSIGRRVRYPEALKKQVAALRTAGIPALRLAAELKLATSQVHDWHKTYSQQEPQVFDIRRQPASLGAANGEQISISVGSVVLTIAIKGALGNVT